MSDVSSTGPSTPALRPTRPAPSTPPLLRPHLLSTQISIPLRLQTPFRPLPLQPEHIAIQAIGNQSVTFVENQSHSLQTISNSNFPNFSLVPMEPLPLLLQLHQHHLSHSDHLHTLINNQSLLPLDHMFYFPTHLCMYRRIPSRPQGWSIRPGVICPIWIKP
jgi:hypothetical protein